MRSLSMLLATKVLELCATLPLPTMILILACKNEPRRAQASFVYDKSAIALLLAKVTKPPAERNEECNIVSS